MAYDNFSSMEEWRTKCREWANQNTTGQPAYQSLVNRIGYKYEINPYDVESVFDDYFHPSYEDALQSTPDDDIIEILEDTLDSRLNS